MSARERREKGQSVSQVKIKSTEELSKGNGESRARDAEVWASIRLIRWAMVRMAQSDLADA